MARIARRHRIHCKLRCQIMGGRRPVEASVATISESGLGLVAPLSLEQGDSIRLRILPPGRTEGVDVSAIVWNDQQARVAKPRPDLRLLGCVVSDPPDAFLVLVKRLDRRPAAGAVRPPTPIAKPKPFDTLDAPIDETSDLPRLREPIPPPKPDPEETLPTFRVRMKQISGPRSRTVRLRARSVAEAESAARSQLETRSDGSPAWELLEVVLAG
jgi:hypothetical protein